MKAKQKRKVGGSCRMLSAAMIAIVLGVASVPRLQAGDFAVPLESTPPQAEDEWVFGVEVYAWAAGLGADLSNGQSIDLGFDDVLSDLQIGGMLAFDARKGPWFLGMDVLYMDLAGDATDKLGIISLRADVDLRAWIVTPTGGYTVYDGDRGRLDLLGGVRYLHLRNNLRLTASAPPPLGSTTISTTTRTEWWAGIIGVNGHINLSERWYLPFYADIGTGDPDLTWQVFAGVGYRFKNFDLRFGYRYLDWDFESSSSLTDLKAHGLMLGVAFAF